MKKKIKKGNDKERKHDRALIRTANDAESYIITASHPSDVSRSVCFMLL
jgi:hypothetical protein